MTEKQQADKSEEKEATEGKSDKVNAVLNKRHSATKSVLVTIKKELLQIVNALKKRIINLVSSRSILVLDRKRGKLRKSWLSNIKKWTQMDLHSLLSSAQDCQLWRSLSKSVGTPTAQAIGR